MRFLRLLAVTAAVLTVVLSLTPLAEARRPGDSSAGALVLTPEAEVPGPGDLGGSGTGTIKLSNGKGQVCFSFAVQNLSGPIVTIQIHRAPAGQAGPAVLTLSPIYPGVNALNGCVPAGPDLMRDLARYPENYYVNVHTANFPNGAIRAQLGR